jgi:WD40 repeat protein
MEAISVKDPLRWGSFPWVELSDCAAAAVAWSPDGDWVLSVATSSLGNGTYTSTLKICGGQDDASTWSSSVSHIDLSPSTPQQLWAASWSPNAQWAAAVSSVPTMQLWGGSNNPTAWNTTAQKELTGLSTYSVGIAWSPNGQWLASGSATANGVLGNVLLWGGSINPLAWNSTPAITLTGPTADTNAVAWSPDGLWLAGVSADSTVRLWGGNADPSTWSTAAVATFTGNTDFVSSIAWSPNGLWFATGNGNGTSPSAKVWGGANNPLTWATTPIITLPSGCNEASTSVAWSPDSQWLSSALCGKLVVWGGSTDVTSWSVFPRVNTSNSGATSVAWSPNGYWAAAGSSDHTAHIWGASCPYGYQTDEDGDCVRTFALSYNQVLLTLTGVDASQFNATVSAKVTRAFLVLLGLNHTQTGTEMVAATEENGDCKLTISIYPGASLNTTYVASALDAASLAFNASTAAVTVFFNVIADATGVSVSSLHATLFHYISGIAGDGSVPNDTASWLSFLWSLAGAIPLGGFLAKLYNGYKTKSNAN